MAEVVPKLFKAIIVFSDGATIYSDVIGLPADQLKTHVGGRKCGPHFQSYHPRKLVDGINSKCVGFEFCVNSLVPSGKSVASMLCNIKRQICKKRSADHRFVAYLRIINHWKLLSSRRLCMKYFQVNENPFVASKRPHHTAAVV